MNYQDALEVLSPTVDGAIELLKAKPDHPVRKSQDPYGSFINFVRQRLDAKADKFDNNHIAYTLGMLISRRAKADPTDAKLRQLHVWWRSAVESKRKCQKVSSRKCIVTP